MEITWYFDLVDPLSYLMAREVDAVEAAGTAAVRRIPVELRPPPAPLTTPDDPFWAPRWEEARRLAGGGLAVPGLVPRSTKAHELLLHAAEHGLEDAARRALFRAFHAEGRDIGRIDVLVEIAEALGLDRTEAKAVLDVDRHTERVRALAAEARAGGVSSVPALSTGSGVLEGFHNRDAIGTFVSST